MVSPYRRGQQPDLPAAGHGVRSPSPPSSPDPDATFEETAAIGTEIRHAMPEIEGVQIELGGGGFAEFEVPSSEALGLGFAIVILIIAFGSVLAMGLPVGVALAGIVAGSDARRAALSTSSSMPNFATTIGVMIGLGVGIDYALFIVTRFRENLHKGHGVEASTVIAMDTAGRAVLFAGTTVVISLMGMLIMQLAFVTGLADRRPSWWPMTLIASLTLLPALLGFVGERVEVTRWRGPHRRRARRPRPDRRRRRVPGPRADRDPAPRSSCSSPASPSSRCASGCSSASRKPPRADRRPTGGAGSSSAARGRPCSSAPILLVLALPVLGLRLGFSDEGNYPEDTTTRQAYDLLAEGFGPGFNGPLLLVTEVPEGTDQAALEDVSDAIAADRRRRLCLSPPSPTIRTARPPSCGG